LGSSDRQPRPPSRSPSGTSSNGGSYDPVWGESARLWLQVREGKRTQAAKRRAVVLAATQTNLSGGRRHDLRLRLTNTGRRAFRRQRSLPMTVFAYALDRSNNKGTAIAQSRIRR
jgi:hypothetical protein